jgi:regulation of enolase protein 1 (concanavalin A-like superfamily)
MCGTWRGTNGRAIVIYRSLAVAVALAAAAGLVTARPEAQAATCGIAMRLLVLSADGQEASLPAIKQALDYLGTPYTTHIADDHPGGLTSSFLANDCRGNFQAIIQTTGDLVAQDDGGTWARTLTDGERQALAAYEAQFNIRQVTWYTYPTPEFGFTTTPEAVDTTGAPLPLKLTAAGQAIFPYLVKDSSALAVQDAYTYLAYAADPSATPIITDAAGHALGVVKRFADGRENLALTFDSNQYLIHGTLFAYGIIDWATRGLFVGERHIYMSPQVDDIFIDAARWLPTTPCGTDPEQSGVFHRMTGNDMRLIDAWQAQRNQQPATAGLRVTMAFNGEGTTGIYDDDTLTPAARAVQDRFHWVSHTFDHELLDDLGYSASHAELAMNNDIGRQLGLSSFTPMNLVTPEISGLTNPDFLRAAVDAGVRNVVSDASKPGYDNPLPNIGMVNPVEPSILMIPRRANNLFYNVVTPADWTAEYNCLYQSYWGRRLTYDEVLSLESSQLLMYLLRGDNDPWMFHQPNLVAYDGAHTLFTDLLDRTIDRYKALYTLPILSPSMDELGASIRRRMQFLSARVDATLQPDGSIHLSSDKAVAVPVTGASIAGAESYGGEAIAWIGLGAGSPISVPLSPPAPLPAGWSHADIGEVGVVGTAGFDTPTSAFSVRGAGADVWGSADAFHFAYQEVTGNARIVARVAAVQNVNAWTKAGVMIRKSLLPGSAHAFMLVSPGKGLAFQRRAADGGSSVHTAGPLVAAPYWVRLDRVGSSVSAYQSSDGSVWTQVGTSTIATGASVFVGLGVSSHVTSRLATASFDSVSVTAIAPPLALPAGWSQQDVGAVGKSGAGTFDAAGGTFSVKGAGADVWGTADAFRYVYRPLSGDGRIVARVATVENVAAWVKAGVMIRESLTPGSPHGFMLVSAGKGTAFQRRTAPGGVSTSTAGPFVAAPHWMAIERTGDVITASVSADGVMWTPVASDTIPMITDVFVGLGVSSHTTAATATATFTSVGVSVP